MVLCQHYRPWVTCNSWGNVMWNTSLHTYKSPHLQISTLTNLHTYKSSLVQVTGQAALTYECKRPGCSSTVCSFWNIFKEAFVYQVVNLCLHPILPICNTICGIKLFANIQLHCNDQAHHLSNFWVVKYPVWWSWIERSKNVTQLAQDYNSPCTHHLFGNSTYHELKNFNIGLGQAPYATWMNL